MDRVGTVIQSCKPYTAGTLPDPFAWVPRCCATCDNQMTTDYRPGSRKVANYYYAQGEAEIKQALQRSVGILVFGVMTDLYNWVQSSTSNVYAPRSTAQRVGAHMVEIVGWGAAGTTITRATGTPRTFTASEPYWIIKNSWGAGGPHRGYLYLSIARVNWMPQAIFICYSNATCPRDRPLYRRLSEMTVSFDGTSNTNATGSNSSSSDSIAAFRTGFVDFDSESEVAQEVITLLRTYTEPVCREGSGDVSNVTDITLFTLGSLVTTGIKWQVTYAFEQGEGSTCVDAYTSYDAEVILDSEGNYTLLGFSAHNNATSPLPPLSFVRRVIAKLESWLNTPVVFGLVAGVVIVGFLSLVFVIGWVASLRYHERTKRELAATHRALHVSKAHVEVHQSEVFKLNRRLEVASRRFKVTPEELDLDGDGIPDSEQADDGVVKVSAPALYAHRADGHDTPQPSPAASAKGERPKSAHATPAPEPTPTAVTPPGAPAVPRTPTA